MSMPESRIAKHSYSLLVREDERGKTNWATHIRCMLNRYGFGHAWINQGVGNEALRSGLVGQIAGVTIYETSNITIDLVKVARTGRLYLSRIRSSFQEYIFEFIFHPYM